MTVVWKLESYYGGRLIHHWWVKDESKKDELVAEGKRHINGPWLMKVFKFVLEDYEEITPENACPVDDVPSET